MTTLAALHGNLQRLIALCWSSLPSANLLGVYIRTARATNIQLALGLRVEVEQNITLQDAALQAESTIHTSLLSRCDKTLDRTVSHAVILKDCEDCSHTDTIVCAKSCAVCSHPLAIDVSLDWVVDEVKHLVVVLLWHHIHMRLQNDTLSVLHTRSRWLCHIYIARLVHRVLDVVRHGKVHQILANLILAVRWVRYVTNLSKVLPHQCWVQCC